MKVEKISELTTNRLSVYLRCLRDLASQGIRTVSSEDLAEKFHLNSAQIRKDVAYFGEFGVRGVGYSVEELSNHITKILGLDREHKVAIIGAGRLGSALADYYRFSQSNFKISAMFDKEPNKIGGRAGDVSVYDFRDFEAIVRERGIDVAVIAVPEKAAHDVFQKILSAGITAILNFAPTPLKAEKNVKVKTVDLTISLESLSYFLAQPTKTNGSEKMLKPRQKRSRKMIKKPARSRRKLR